ncbi:MAG: PEP-CTERM system TPR-repeat protein PrsT [Gammaproteobacteria bacterium]|nr:PEP-CTERM system TPR-repeat protein PrsT [Gammaproteobacteria bacterium]
MNRFPLRSMPPLTALVLAVALTLPACADPSTAARYYEKAVGHYEAGEFSAAVVELKNAIQQDKSLLPAHVLIGRAYLGLGQGANAEEELKLAAKRGADPAVVTPLIADAYLMQFKYFELLRELQADGLPRPARLLMLLARAQAHLEVGDLQQADDDFSAAAALDAASVRPQIGLAMTALRRGDDDAALEHAQIAIDLDPANAQAWNTKASVVHARGDTDAALAAYGKALELDPMHREARIARAGLYVDLGREQESRADLLFLADNFPDDPRAAYLRAVKLARAGDGAGARSQLAEVTATVETFDRAWLDRNQQLLMLAGIAHYSMGQFEKAVDYLGRYVELYPHVVGARKLLGSAQLKLGDVDKALNVLTVARTEAPGDPKVLSLLARAWMGKGNHEKATTLLEEATALPGAGAEVRTQLAFARLQRGDVDAALEELDTVLGSEEDAADAELLAAMVHMRRREYAEALRLAERLKAHASTNLTVLNLLASAQAGLGDLAAARRTYDEILAGNPGFMPTRLNVARLAERAGHPDKAREMLQALLVERPNDQMTLIELARLEERAGQREAAVRWLEQARAADSEAIATRLYLTKLLLDLKELERAGRVIYEAQARAPRNLSVLDTVARVQLAQSKPELARGTLRRMADEAGFDARWLLRIADFQARLGVADDAQHSLNKAIQGDPDYVPARIAMVEQALAQGDIERAATAADALARLAPATAVTESLLGDVALARGEPDPAVTHYQAALAREQFGLFAVKLATARLAAGQSQTALEELSAWLRRYPQDDAVRHARAEAYLVAGNERAALADYRQLVDHLPDDAGALNNLAFLLESAGDADALTYARRAYELRPGDPSVADTLGWILVRHGQAEEGLRYLREAHTRDSGSPTVRYHLAMALAALDRQDEARRELDTALGSGKQFNELADARALRAKLAD